MPQGIKLRLIAWASLAAMAPLGFFANMLAADDSRETPSRNQFVSLLEDAEGRKEGKKPMPAPLKYPTTRHSDHVDDYQGVKISDPYRWLEDPDSDETTAWVKAQNKVTFGYLKKLSHRKAFQQRLTELWNYERFGLPRKRAANYFFTRNDGLQNQSVLYVSEGLGGKPRQLLDPNTLSEDGTVALAGWAPSENGKLLAYGLASAGSDWREWKVMDVASGKTLDDHLEWVKFSGVSWTPDERGFFYSRYDEPKKGEEFTAQNYFQKLYYHKIGDDQSDDVLIYERKDEKEWGFGGSVTEDGRYLTITVWRGTERKNQVFYRDLSEEDSPVVELLAGFDAEYDFVGNDGPRFWFATDKDAPKRRLIEIDTRKPEPEHWKVIVPETEHVLQGASYVGGGFWDATLGNDTASSVEFEDYVLTSLDDADLAGLGVRRRRG